MSDLIPRLGDWVASRKAVKQRGLLHVMRWHVGDVKDETMVIENHRYGWRQVKVADWVVVYRPEDRKT